MKGLAFVLAGIFGWVQTLWLPLYIGISEDNIYIWAVCDNCRGFSWVISSIAIIIGGLLIFLSKKHADDYNDIVGKGMTFYLVFTILVNILTIF